MTVARQISREDIVEAGLRVLNDVGLDKFTMRLVAAALGVQQNTIFWHVKSKSALLDLMADDLLADCQRGELAADWQERTRELANRYRTALLTYRDGGRLSIARFSALPHLRWLSEEVHRAFLDGGLAPADASNAAWLLSYLTLASVIEEQGEPENWRDTLASQSSEAVDERLRTALAHPLASDHRARFEFGIETLLRGCVGRPERATP